jgi:aspartate/methionine/tyrosine aminotransferase
MLILHLMDIKLLLFSKQRVHLDVAVECFTLSKSYNMAGWRVGCIVGNEKLIGALKRIKSWLRLWYVYSNPNRGYCCP